ncbi:MAG: hypothetical protein IKE52_06220 [Mogibacterium sp.]|nr:hypothetical protein [Mogibacterium sp.]
MGSHRLNIVLSKTNTRIGSMIRAVIGGKYNHCSFYVDDEVDKIYGFSRKYRELWYTGCFTQENPIYYDEYQVYQIPLSNVQNERLRERIDEMNANIHMYNYISAMLLPANIPVASDSSFICSTFVADLIDKYTDIELEKDVLLYRPMDIFELMKDRAEKGFASRAWESLVEKEETPLDFAEVFRDWETTVKKVTKGNIALISNALNDYENWLRDTIYAAEQQNTAV